MQLPLYDLNANGTDTLEVSDVVFGAAENTELLHQALVYHRANQRRGSGSTLTRGQVSGTGRKPFSQKGTGRARQGSWKSPHHRGGGVGVRADAPLVPAAHAEADAPPGDQDGAVRQGRSRAGCSSWRALDSLEQKTKAMAGVLSAFEVKGSALVVLGSGIADRRRGAEHPAREGHPRRPRERARPAALRRGAHEPGRGPAHGRDMVGHPPRANAGGGGLMHIFQVLKRPLITEKSTLLQEQNKYVFEVMPAANKIQVREAVQRAYEVRVTNREHGAHRGREPAPAQRAVAADSRDQEGESSPSLPATRSSCSRERSDAAEAIEPHQPRRSRRGAPRFLGGDAALAAQAADEGPPQERRQERSRQDDRPPSRRRREARLARDRLQAQQAGRPLQGGVHRVRPEPLRAHRAAAVRGRRAALHPRSRRGEGGRLPHVRPGRGYPRGQRDAVAEHPHRHDGAQHRVAARQGRPGVPGARAPARSCSPGTTRRPCCGCRPARSGASPARARPR